MTKQTPFLSGKFPTIERLCCAIFETSNLGILATDRNGYIIYINEVARAILDITDEDKILNISDVSPASSSDYMDIVKTGKQQVNKPFSIKDRIYVAHRHPLTEENEIIGVSCIFQDIAPYENLVKNYYEIQEYADEIQAIVESSYDGIFVTDGDAKIIRFNSAYENITGIKASEVIGRNMKDLVSEGYYSESCTLKVLASGKTETLNQVLKTGKAVLVTGNPIFDEKGKIKMVVTNVRDMTDLVELNRRLEDSLEMTSAYKEKLQEGGKHYGQTYYRGNRVYWFGASAYTG